MLKHRCPSSRSGHGWVFTIIGYRRPAAAVAAEEE